MFNDSTSACFCFSIYVFTSIFIIFLFFLPGIYSKFKKEWIFIDTIYITTIQMLYMNIKYMYVEKDILSLGMKLHDFLIGSKLFN